MPCSSSSRALFSVIMLIIAIETPSMTLAQTENFFTFNLVLKDGISGVDGLDDVFASAVSPDGKHLYAVAGGDNSISLFQRNRTTGFLTFVDKWQVDVASESDDHYVVISPDGRHVYVTAESADSVLVFGRNITSGLLNYVELIDLGSLGFGDVRRIEISPDGENLFTTV